MTILDQPGTRHTLACLCMLACLASRAAANDLSAALKLDTGFQPEGFAYSLDFSLRAPRAEAEIHLELPDPIPFTVPELNRMIPTGTGGSTRLIPGLLKPETRSWACRITPIPPLSIYTGALSVHGLASRALDPVPYVASPFHNGVRTEKTPVLETGTARATGNLAFEAGDGGPHLLAACISRPFLEFPEVRETGTSTWLLYRFSPYARRKEPVHLAMAALGGVTRPEPREPDSWFSASPQQPQTELRFSALEAEFASSSLRARLSGFGNSGPCRETTGALAGEISLAAGGWTLSGGGFAARNGFLELSGTSTSIVSRFFIAPLFIIPFSARSPYNLRWGAIIHSDIRKGEGWKDGEYRELGGGSGMSLVTAKTSTNLKAMYSESGWKFSASRRRREWPARTMTAETGGYIELAPAGHTFGEPAGAGFSAEVGWKPWSAFSLLTDISLETDRISDPLPSLAAECGISASGRVRSSFPALRISGSLTLSLPEYTGRGSLSLQLALP